MSFSSKSTPLTEALPFRVKIRCSVPALDGTVRANGSSVFKEYKANPFRSKTLKREFDSKLFLKKLRARRQLPFSQL